MSNKYASGRYALAICDRCGLTFKLLSLRELVVKNATSLKVCRSCWEPSHPQLELGSVRADDAQALYQPRPDVTIGSASAVGRLLYWGWNPVGGGMNELTGAPDPTQACAECGTVSVEGAT